MVPTTTLESLSDNMLATVLTYLPLHQLIPLRAINHRFQTLITQMITHIDVDQDLIAPFENKSTSLHSDATVACLVEQVLGQMSGQQNSSGTQLCVVNLTWTVPSKLNGASGKVIGSLFPHLVELHLPQTTDTFWSQLCTGMNFNSFAQTLTTLTAKTFPLSMLTKLPRLVYLDACIVADDDDLNQTMTFNRSTFDRLRSLHFVAELEQDVVMKILDFFKESDNLVEPKGDSSAVKEDSISSSSSGLELTNIARIRLRFSVSHYRRNYDSFLGAVVQLFPRLVQLELDGLIFSDISEVKRLSPTLINLMIRECEFVQQTKPLVAEQLESEPPPSAVRETTLGNLVNLKTFSLICEPIQAEDCLESAAPQSLSPVMKFNFLTNFTHLRSFNVSNCLMFNVDALQTLTQIESIHLKILIINNTPAVCDEGTKLIATKSKLSQWHLLELGISGGCAREIFATPPVATEANSKRNSIVAAEKTETTTKPSKPDMIHAKAEPCQKSEVKPKNPTSESPELSRATHVPGLSNKAVGDILFSCESLQRLDLSNNTSLDNRVFNHILAAKSRVLMFVNLNGTQVSAGGLLTFVCDRKKGITGRKNQKQQPPKKGNSAADDANDLPLPLLRLFVDAVAYPKEDSQFALDARQARLSLPQKQYREWGVARVNSCV